MQSLGLQLLLCSFPRIERPGGDFEIPSARLLFPLWPRLRRAEVALGGPEAALLRAQVTLGESGSKPDQTPLLRNSTFQSWVSMFLNESEKAGSPHNFLPTWRAGSHAGGRARKNAGSERSLEKLQTAGFSIS